MKIGIIGSGKVGGHLGQGLANKGHQVKFGSREPHSDKIASLVAAAGPHASAGTATETVSFGDVIVVAVPWSGLESVVTSAGAWSGKIVMDTTNRPGPSATGLSAAEDLALLLPGAKVVKTFNTIGVEHMVNPEFGDQSPTMFICGDDPEAKRIVTKLVEDLGFDIVDVGPLSAATLLESLGWLWITLSRGDLGRNIAFKLLRR